MTTKQQIDELHPITIDSIDQAIQQMLSKHMVPCGCLYDDERTSIWLCKYHEGVEFGAEQEREAVYETVYRTLLDIDLPEGTVSTVMRALHGIDPTTGRTPE